MSRKAYLFIGRLVTPFALVGLRIYTLLTARERVRVLVLNEKNEVLLLKGVISHQQWTLPGGGMNRNESAVAAARRELHEETGILVPHSQFEYLRTLEKPDVHIPFRAPLLRVYVRADDLPAVMVNRLEIAAIQWFDPNDLPSQISEIAEFALTKIEK